MSIEKKCEENGMSYLTNPVQSKCKNCGRFWFTKDAIPNCKLVEINTIFVEPHHDSWGSELGQILADFEQDHDAIKVTHNTHALIAQQKSSTLSTYKSELRKKLEERIIKIPCVCPKGGLVGEGERPCEKCDGSEWMYKECSHNSALMIAINLLDN